MRFRRIGLFSLVLQIRKRMTGQMMIFKKKLHDAVGVNNKRFYIAALFFSVEHSFTYSRSCKILVISMWFDAVNASFPTGVWLGFDRQLKICLWNAPTFWTRKIRCTSLEKFKDLTNDLALSKAKLSEWLTHGAFWAFRFILRISDCTPACFPFVLVPLSYDWLR